MKVKVFDEENESDLENKINSFIENVDEIYDIKYNVAVGISGEDQIYCFSALIMYEWGWLWKKRILWVAQL